MDNIEKREYEYLRREIDFKNKLYYWLFTGKSWVKPEAPAKSINMPDITGRKKPSMADQKGLLIFLIIIVIFGIFIRVSVNTDNAWESSRYTPAQEQALDGGEE